MVNRDSLTGLFLLLLAIGALTQSSGLTAMSAVFPQTIAYGLLILSLIYMIKSMQKVQKREGSSESGKVMMITLSLLGYFLLIWVSGFLIASLLFMTYLVYALQQNKQVTRALLYSVCCVGGFYALFKFVFLVPFPSGLIFPS